MGIEVVDPEKESLPPVVLQPSTDREVDPVGLPFQETEGEGTSCRPFGRRPIGLVVVVVMVESLIEVDLGVEGKGGENRPGGESLDLEDFGQSGDAVVEEVTVVIVHPVEHRKGAGHDGGVRRESHRYGGDGVGEPDRSIGGKRIEVGGVSRVMAGETEVVGAGGIQRNDHEVRSDFGIRASRQDDDGNHEKDRATDHNRSGWIVAWTESRIPVRICVLVSSRWCSRYFSTTDRRASSKDSSRDSSISSSFTSM